jgi:hypothetical protein
MKAMDEREDKASWIESLIKGFIAFSPENTLKNKTDEQAFDEPLVGFSRGDDPIYEEYRTFVGPFHWTPLEIFNLTFPQVHVTQDELTVIVWVLPQTKITKSDNRKEIFYPSDRWARARIFGEEVNVKLRRHVVDALNRQGYMAVAPLLSPHWETKTSDAYVFASNWSERHAAYASGLGTFGLCDGLITPKGKAIRVGSVVARVQMPPTPRAYTDHNAYCLFYSQGICGECIPRCPVGALSEDGHDKVKCLNHLRPVTADYVKAQYGFDGYGCGLCQTGVPCESKIPVKKDVAS